MSNQWREHILLTEQGIDLIILDHHMSEKFNEGAIIVNNQLSEKYPNKTLCGAGVVYKFCEVYDALYNFNFSHLYIDLVAIALIGDMMDLRNIETRFLIKTGLEKKDKNPFIQAAIIARSFSIGDISKIKPVDISFYIVPLINALVRVGKQNEKEILFESMIDGNRIVPSLKRGAKEGDTEILCEQAVRICTNAHSRQAKAKEKALDSLDVKINKNSLMDNQIIFVPIEEGDVEIDTALTGLIAMQITAKYSKPTIVARKDSEDIWRGSARASDKTIDDLRQFFLDSGYFIMAEGHPLAHGIAIEDKKVDSFIDYANKELADVNFNENTYMVDFIINANNEHFTRIVRELGELTNLWGQGIQEPLIAIENLRVPIKDVQIIGKLEDTVKISVKDINLIRFKDKEFAEEIMKYSFVDLTIIGKSNLNEWNGIITSQVFILDYTIKGNNFDF